MKSVHSEDLGVTITGNMITRHNVPAEHLPILGAIYGHIAVEYVGGEKFNVSSHMNEPDRQRFAGLIHRLNSENKVAKKPEGTDPDGTPPSGGTPGTPVIVEQEWVEAVAA